MPGAQHPSHVYPLGSRLNEAGRLEVGGCDVVELAAEFGTPAYVVAPDDIRARARAIAGAYGAATPACDVVFASKAFPCTAVYRLLAEEGLGCDVASGGELAMALRGGFSPERIHLHGNAKTREELAHALDVGIGHVIADNTRDLDVLEELLAERSGQVQSILLRIAPGISPATHPSISTGGPNTKFGFSLHDAPAAIARAQDSDRLHVEGLHFHIGSQLMDNAPYQAALEAIAGLGSFPAVNLGGGLGVAYVEADRPPSIEDYVAAKVRAVHDVLGPSVRIVDEPGRALVANAGVTLYTVQSVKHNVDTWVAVDGGMSDNLRPMLYGAVYEAEIADRFGGGTRCNVAGKHCESGDVLVRDADLADPRPGDILVTPVTGAYGHAMANTYNGAQRPPVVFASGGDARLVVRRETHEDLFTRDV